MVNPKESSHFGFYSDCSMTEVLPYWHPDSPLGLKTTLMKMNETGTLKLVSVPGGHMDLYWTTIDYIAQFLNSALP